METLNKPLIAILALAAFIWLCWYSWPHNEGYTASQRASMQRLVASVSKAHRMMSKENAMKMVYLFNQQEKE